MFFGVHNIQAHTVMKRIKNKIIAFLKQGMTPHDLAFALALGVALGTFPVVGTTTLLCTAASVLLRLNLPAIQSVNWAVSPLQLTLLIPFFRLGSAIFGSSAVTVSLAALITMMQTDPIGTISKFFIVTLHGIGAWALVAPPTAVLVFILALPLISRLQMQYIRIHSDDEAEQQ
jgi:uncharacterized protein (DUF2062 family)